MEKTFAYAQTLACDGEFGKAFEVLSGLDRDDEANCLYVSVCRRLNKIELAERELALILAQNPDHPRANHLRAIGILEGTDLGHEKLAEAENYLAKAERGYGKEQLENLSELYLDWGNLHYERNDTLKAIVCWRRAVQLSPKNDVAAKNLAEFDDVDFSRAATVNEMIGMARHPAQVLAHLMRHQNFATLQEAQDFANEIMSLWNRTRAGR